MKKWDGMGPRTIPATALPEFINILPPTFFKEGKKKEYLLTFALTSNRIISSLGTLCVWGKPLFP